MLIFKSLSMLTLVTALIYTCGWAFASKYFDIFGLGLATLNISFEQYILFGFVVLHQYLNLLLVFLVVVGMAVYFISVNSTKVSSVLKGLNIPFPKQDAGKIVIVNFFVFVLVLILFYCSYRLGSVTADITYEEHWLQDHPANPRIVIILKNATSKRQYENDKYTPANYQNGCFRLLRETNGAVYVFTRAIEHAVKPILHEVQKSEIELIQILPERSSCKDSNPFQ